MQKVFHDGSGKDHDPKCQYVTLAGFAGTDSIWDNFERTWNEILQDRGPVSCIHMVDAIRHEEEFEGWDSYKTDFLIKGLIGFLREVTVRDAPRFCGFRATVDIEAHQRWQTVNNLPPIAQLCANLCFGKMFVWYGNFPDPIIGNIELFFDRGDPYLNVLMQQWNNKEIVEEHPWWKLVTGITSKALCDYPGLQAADMLAWSHNRLKTLGDSGWAGRLAREIAASISCWHYDLNDEALRSKKFPNKYGFYT